MQETGNINRLPMTSATGVKDTDIGHHSARHHQCEADGEEGMDGEAEGIEEAEVGDKVE